MKNGDFGIKIWRWWMWVKNNSTINIIRNPSPNDYYMKALNATTKSEFVSLIDQGFQGRDTKFLEALKQWNEMNPNGDVFLDRNELKRYLGGAYSEYVVNQFFIKGDTDEDEKVSFEEYLYMVEDRITQTQFDKLLRRLLEVGLGMTDISARVELCRQLAKEGVSIEGVVTGLDYIHPDSILTYNYTLPAENVVDEELTIPEADPGMQTSVENSTGFNHK